MAREYDAQEKIAYVEEYGNSGMSIAEFAREKRLPVSTLRSWIRLHQPMTFGENNLSQTTSITKTVTIVPKKPTVFVGDNIRIELRGYRSNKIVTKLFKMLKLSYCIYSKNMVYLFHTEFKYSCNLG